MPIKIGQEVEEEVARRIIQTKEEIQGVMVLMD